MDFFRNAGLVFENEAQRQEMFRLGEQVSKLLQGPQPPWPMP
jgi:hypothetical protein